MEAAQNHPKANLIRSWYWAMVWISVFFVAVTFASYAWPNLGPFSRLLFWVGLGGENNLGAWWSGMLLLIGALHAFDGFGNMDNPTSARRGWLVLSAILMALSFDELASLHEFLSRTGDDRYLLIFAIIGAFSLVYSLRQLAKPKVPGRALALIVLSFVLFGSVYLQEVFQSFFVTLNNPLVYALRSVAEEGTEIIAMLILIHVAGANTRELLSKNQPDALVAAAPGKYPLMIAAAALIPIMAGATFILPFPGGPADWLAACIYFFGAVLVFRTILFGREALRRETALLLLFYLLASALSNGLKLEWDPEIFGVPVSIRGLGIAGILLTANMFFRFAKRRTIFWFYPAAAVALLASLWPSSQLLWCAIPPCVALWFFAIENRQHTV